ncbi:hypothetical protein [Aureliella helgolandensis]|uniref:Uncharacterized protein n=1 Tax=Aureliella helgolandensis TaxID=2527968 RepID=A0A518G882_9BACT|nr:hypothetical protein [Aureliella helgolandensis]QDV24794.1 hypothetical protein Q31a_31160 [Aureliella helgolandensis]
MRFIDSYLGCKSTVVVLVMSSIETSANSEVQRSLCQMIIASCVPDAPEWLGLAQPENDAGDLDRTACVRTRGLFA